MAKTAYEACIEFVATLVEIGMAFLLVKREKLLLDALELSYQLLGAVAYCIVSADKVEIVVVNDGPFDVGIGLKHVKEE